MKKNIFNFLLVIQFVCMAFVSSAQLLDRECIKNNATAQNLISEKISQFSQVTTQISTLEEMPKAPPKLGSILFIF